MAKNIKKRSASHIYFGVNKLTGELKHISEWLFGVAPSDVAVPSMA